MTKYRQEIEQEDGWSDEIAPNMDVYKMACCDCGLVHDITFWVVKVTKENDDGTWECEDTDKSYRVIFRARRNKRSTGQVRRHKKIQELE
jgi:hypothetical protein